MFSSSLAHVTYSWNLKKKAQTLITKKKNAIYKTNNNKNDTYNTNYDSIFVPERTPKPPDPKERDKVPNTVKIVNGIREYTD